MLLELPKLPPLTQGIRSTPVGRIINMCCALRLPAHIDMPLQLLRPSTAAAGPLSLHVARSCVHTPLPACVCRQRTNSPLQLSYRLTPLHAQTTACLCVCAPTHPCSCLWERAVQFVHYEPSPLQKVRAHPTACLCVPQLTPAAVSPTQPLACTTHCLPVCVCVCPHSPLQLSLGMCRPVCPL
jgi:hypothetical protein